MKAIDHELYEELAVGHALSALEPEDELTFLAHLPSCASCEAALIEHQQTMGQLAYATAVEEPPASLLEGIRAEVAASGRAGVFPAPLSLARARDRRRGRTVKLTTALVGVAASFLLVAALVVANLGLSSRYSTEKTAVGQFKTTVASVLTPNARRVELKGGSGEAVAVVNGNNVSLVMSGVSANDSKSEYVLWQRVNGNLKPVGGFNVKTSGITLVNKGLTVDGADATELLVTKEAGHIVPATPSTVLYSGAA